MTGSLTALASPCSSVSTRKSVIKNVTVIEWGTIHDLTGPLSITIVLVIYLAHVFVGPAQQPAERLQLVDGEGKRMRPRF